jgi:hypothetical protein
MDLAPVIEALQATLSPQHRKQAEEKLAQVHFLSTKNSNSIHCFRSAKQLVLSHVLCRLFSMNNVIWVLDKLVKLFIYIYLFKKKSNQYLS